MEEITGQSISEPKANWCVAMKRLECQGQNALPDAGDQGRCAQGATSAAAELSTLSLSMTIAAKPLGSGKFQPPTDGVTICYAQERQTKLAWPV